MLRERQRSKVTISTKIDQNKLRDNKDDPMQLEDEQKNGDEEYTICSEYLVTPSTEKLDSSQKVGSQQESEDEGIEIQQNDTSDFHLTFHQHR